LTLTFALFSVSVTSHASIGVCGVLFPDLLEVSSLITSQYFVQFVGCFQ